MIHIADRFAATNIAVGFGRQEHLAHPGDGLRAALAEIFREPALHVGVDDRARPLSRTFFSRPSQMDLSGKNDDVLERTSLSTRPGACAPSHCPTIPPIDSPHQLILGMPSASMTARTSRPSRSIV